jgi:CDGSH-type Zn-finger protein
LRDAGAARVLANVQGPWIHPDDMDVEELAGVSRNCPSGAIQYVRKDGAPDELKPPVNLIRTLESGPNAFRGDLRIDGKPIGYRATLCRCGASKNKPYCDGSHHDVHFEASGEPPTGDKTDMLAVRDGPVEIAPQTDGPLMVRGNLEFISGTGRMFSRRTAAKLCRCGGSQTKPFCDNTHVKIGFKSV